MNHFDFIIVGNGVIAHSIAFELISQNSNLHIAMIGPDNYEGSATQAAGAMLGCFGEVSALCTRYRPQHEKFQLSLQAQRLWGKWLDRLNHHLAQPQTVRHGTFVMLNAKSGLLDNDNYDAMIQLLNQYREPYQTMKADAIPGINPVTDSRPFNAVYLPNENSIDAHELMNNLHTIISQHPNIHYFNQKIAKVHHQHYQITAVEDFQGNRYSGNQYIFAAGAFTQTLIDQIPVLKSRVPRLFYGVGISLLLSLPKVDIQHVIRTPNRSFACGLHVVPRSDTLLYLGSTNNVASCPAFLPKPAQLHFLLQCLLQQINQDYHLSQIVKIQVGNRPVPFDTFPTFGATSMENLILASGTYRDGILLSPLIAGYIAQLALTQQELFNNPFPCERPPIMPMSQQEVINNAVKHYMSGAFEHDTQLPKVGWYEMFHSMIRDKITRLYQAIGDDDIFIPGDLLLMFDDHYSQSLHDFRQYLQEIKQEYPRYHFNQALDLSTAEEPAVC
ncbi:MAG: FAD-binding oxidoreductase [Legionellales bacterium]|nr:FAD-binding oxidoreductase [Legionellales bacterium]